MARVLVVGGAGYVGSHGVKAATEAGHDCVVYDSLVSGHREFVRWGPLVVGDIRDGDRLRQTLRDHRIEAVMHFAALADVGLSMRDPGAYYDVNVGGTRTLLDAMRETGVQPLVFSSTCAVYGQPEITPIAEDTPVRPINPYGFSKHACERMIADFGTAHGLRAACLRYFNAAGADPDALIGEDHAPENHLIPLVLDAAMDRRAAITIFGTDYPTDDGTAVRDYIHVCDLAAAHVAALRHLLAGGGGFAANLGTGTGVSVRAMVTAARHVTGNPVPVQEGGRRAGDPAVLVAARTKAVALADWVPVRSAIDVILADAWRWHTRRFGAQARPQDAGAAR